MKKILITGGFGFIGTTLVEFLARDKENKIHVIDNMSTSPIDIKDYLEVIENPKSLSYEIISVDKFFRRRKIGRWDEIYHLASPVGPVGVLKHGGDIIREVVRDGYWIIDYCLKNRAKLLYVSTSEIYGGGKNGYCPETADRIVSSKTNIRMEYAIAKLAVETAIINNCKTKGLKAAIVRPFNVVGKRQSVKGGFVLPRFIQQAYQNKDITVFGNGKAIRSLTNVKDVTQGIILAMKEGKNGEVYNLGNSKNKINIIQLAEIVKRTLRSQSKIVLVDPKTLFGNFYEEANDKFPDSRKAKRELGFCPRYDIKSTILEAQNEFSRQFKKGILKDKV